MFSPNPCLFEYPIHVYLNTQCIEDYSTWKKEKVVVPNKSGIIGSSNYLRTIIFHQKEFKTLSEITESLL